MARIALALVGTAVGTAFGQPALGYAVGSLVGSLIDPVKGPTVEGPRLSDLNVQSSAEGIGIPLAFGSVRIAGNVIWSTPIQETRQEEEVGGKGLGGGGSQVSYTYSVSFAVGLCEGTITGIRKIWADSKLLYDAGSADAPTLIASQERLKSIRIYTGTETQTADPTIQADKGVADTPAYRGLAYIVFEDLELADFANRIPNITVELIVSGQQTLALLNSVTTPSMAHQQAASSLCASTVQGAAVLCISGYPATSSVDVYTVYPDGTLVKGTTFTSAINGPVAQGFSDEPSFIAQDGLPGGYIYYYRITDNGNVAELTSQIRFPAGISAAFWNSGSVYARNGTLYCFKYHTQGYKVFRAATQGAVTGFGGYEDAELLYDVAAAGLPATLHDIFVGHTKIFGILENHTLYVWDLDFNFIKSIALTPPVNTLDYVHFGGSETQIRSDNDRFVYLISSSPAHIHRVDVDLDQYAYLGSVAVGAWYEMTGGAAVRGNLLTIYSTQSNLKFINLASVAPASITLASIVSTLCQRAGLTPSEMDTTALTDTVDGYVIARPTTARAAIEPLRQGYFFDGIETAGKLKFVGRGGGSIATVTMDDLSAHEAGSEAPDPVVISRVQELDLPVEINIGYLDKDNDYLPGSQQARRLTTSSKGQLSLELPLVMSSLRAAQIADILLRNTWLERTQFQFALLRSSAYLDPTDLITIPTSQGNALVRLTRTDYGEPGIVHIEALAENAVLYASAAVGNHASVNQPQTLSLQGPTKAVFLDIPLLRDKDNEAGYYLAAAGYLSGWKGGVLYKSVDEGATWESMTAVLTAATLGYTTGTLGDFTGGNVWDKGNRANVKLTTPGKTLSSTTELAVYSGANAAAIGAHGRWEIVQFQNVTLEGDGTYTLYDLLRGRRGTEWAMGTHQASDTFVLLTTTTLKRIEAATVEIGLSRDYRAVSIGQTLDSVDTQAFANSAVGLECYSPVNVGGGRNAAGDIVINWERRTRLGGEWRDYVDATLGEASESYEVEVWNTGFSSLKRTITGLTAKTTTYTAAQQTTDFGSTQSAVGVKLFQVSATLGRGYEGRGTV